MYECTSVYECSAHGNQKRKAYLLGVKLYVPSYVDAGNGIQIPARTSDALATEPPLAPGTLF